jgi:hypothetical protein
MGSFDELMALYTCGPNELRRFLGDGPILTDDQPMLEYFRSLRQGERGADVKQLKGDVREILGN